MCAEGMLRTKQRRHSNLPEATVGKNKPKMSSLDCRSTRATRTLNQLWLNRVSWSKTRRTSKRSKTKKMSKDCFDYECKMILFVIFTHCDAMLLIRWEIGGEARGEWLWQKPSPWWSSSSIQFRPLITKLMNLMNQLLWSWSCYNAKP